ncbi:hypothetical protein K2X85_07125 [bacterium]|jgi:hypothetical protein|nr:hypothetical protein [bacterium]
MKRLLTLFAPFVVILLCDTSLSQAHGPMLDVADGRITIQTVETLIDGTPLYDDEFAFNFTNLGWQALPIALGGGHLAPGSTIGMTVLDLAPKLKLTQPAFLFYHDGTSFTDPGSASLAILGTTGVISKTGASFSNLPIGTVIDADDFHDHLGVLLRNGSPGVYGILFSNTTTSPGVASSFPYYLAINNDLGPDGYNKFLRDLNATAIPEVPTLITTLGICLLLLLTRPWTARNG